MKNENQSQAGVNRHTSSEEEEMVKHSPGTQNQTESGQNLGEKNLGETGEHPAKLTEGAVREPMAAKDKTGSAPKGDFCLKDRRKILFKDCINSKNIVTIEFIFNEIEKQDKEFIKRLKEEKCCFICGKGLDRHGRQKRCKYNLCSNCHDSMKKGKWGYIRSKLHKRIDKLGGLE